MLTNRPKTKLLVDGGDPEETLRIKSLIGFVDGQTTNPSLIAKNPEIQKRLASGLPHDSQNRAFSEITEPQFWQNISGSLHYRNNNSPTVCTAKANEYRFRLTGVSEMGHILMCGGGQERQRKARPDLTFAKDFTNNRWPPWSHFGGGIELLCQVPVPLARGRIVSHDAFDEAN